MIFQTYESLTFPKNTISCIIFASTAKAKMRRRHCMTNTKKDSFWKGTSPLNGRGKRAGDSVFTTQQKIKINICYKFLFFPVINRKSKIQIAEFQVITKSPSSCFPVILPCYPPVTPLLFPDSLPKPFYTEKNKLQIQNMMFFLPLNYTAVTFLFVLFFPVPILFYIILI